MIEIIFVTIFIKSNIADVYAFIYKSYINHISIINIINILNFIIFFIFIKKVYATVLINGNKPINAILLNCKVKINEKNVMTIFSFKCSLSL